MKEMAFSIQDVKDFKEAYNKALEARQDQFTFKEEQFLVSYAKYVIQYLESQTVNKK